MSDLERCGARTTAGPPCRLRAGLGTDHKGIGRCKFHGGATQSHRVAAVTAQTRLDAGSFGIETPTSAPEALDLVLGMRRGQVDALAARLRRLEADGVDRDGLADVLRGKDVELRGGDQDGLLPFASLNGPEQARWRGLADAVIEVADRLFSKAELAALSAALDSALVQLGAAGKLSADLDVDERRTRVAEQQADALAGVINAVYAELAAAGLPERWRSLFGDAFTRHLAALDGMPVVEGQAHALGPGERSGARSEETSNEGDSDGG